MGFMCSTFKIEVLVPDLTNEFKINEKENKD